MTIFCRLPSTVRRDFSEPSNLILNTQTTRRTFISLGLLVNSHVPLSAKILYSLAMDSLHCGLESASFQVLGACVPEVGALLRKQNIILCMLSICSSNSMAAVRFLPSSLHERFGREFVLEVSVPFEASVETVNDK